MMAPGHNPGWRGGRLESEAMVTLRPGFARGFRSAGPSSYNRLMTLERLRLPADARFWPAAGVRRVRLRGSLRRAGATLAGHPLAGAQRCRTRCSRARPCADALGGGAFVPPRIAPLAAWLGRPMGAGHRRARGTLRGTARQRMGARGIRRRNRPRLWSLARDVAQLSDELTLGRGRRPRRVRGTPGDEPGAALPSPRGAGPEAAGATGAATLAGAPERRRRCCRRLARTRRTRAAQATAPLVYLSPSRRLTRAGRRARGVGALLSSIDGPSARRCCCWCPTLRPHWRATAAGRGVAGTRRHRRPTFQSHVRADAVRGARRNRRSPLAIVEADLARGRGDRGGAAGARVAARRRRVDRARGARPTDGAPGPRAARTRAGQRARRNGLASFRRPVPRPRSCAGTTSSPTICTGATCWTG